MNFPRPAARFLTLTASSWLLLSPGVRAQAQPPSLPQSVSPLALGPVLVYPFLFAGIEQTDNLLYVAEGADPTATGIRTLQPGIVFDLPFSHSYSRLGYALGLRDYELAGLSQDPSHAAITDTRLNFSNGVIVGVKDTYVNGVLDTQTGDTGGEVPFQGQTYWDNVAGLEVGQERGGRPRFGIRITDRTTRYTGERRAGFFDTDEQGITLTGERQTSVRTWLRGEFFAARADLTRPEGDFFEAEDRTERNRALRLGARWEPHPGYVLDGSLGRARYEYRGTYPSNFEGTVASLLFERRLKEGPSISLSLSRDAYPSVYETNNYYRNHQATLRVSRPEASRIVAGASVSYYVNDYPGSEPFREDRTLSGEGWVGYRTGTRVECRLFVRSDQRRSSDEAYSYDVTRFGLNVRVGG